ncbi:MAG TPA: hypothetical protein ENJ09_02860 [Planctomycetes bacterium]|nr:hypothetical protein [Planctomycetota bacterium]
MLLRPAPILCALLAFASGPVAAQTVFVTTPQNTVDIPPTAMVPDLPGPDGEVSFWEALIVSDNTPGQQTIGFQVPASQFTTFVFILPPPNTGLKYVIDSVIIDGTTQTAFAGDTNPNGHEILISIPLYLVGAGSVVRGLQSTNLRLTFDPSNTSTRADGCTVEDCNQPTLSVDTDDNLVRNLMEGQVAIRGDRNRLVGSVVEKVTVEGSDNIVGGSSPSDRNTILGLYDSDRNTGLPTGVALDLPWAVRATIENNYIGTTPDGLAPANRGAVVGLRIGTSTSIVIRNNLIGGILYQQSNGLIAGQSVLFLGPSNDVRFHGNTIGLDANGDPTLPSLTGITVDPGWNPTNVLIGGSGPGEGNTIAGHLLSGIEVPNTVSGFRISGNSIYGNGLAGFPYLGIDLLGTGNSTPGVTPNDPLDADTGGNGLQNFPVLASAWIDPGGVLQVSGQLDSEPNTNFGIEFFGSSQCDWSGYGQGEVFLGSTAVLTDAAGNAGISVSLGAVPVGWYVTATATREPSGDTSEFSACVQVVDTVCAADEGFMGPGMGTLSICGPPLSTGNSATMTVTSAAPLAPLWVSYGPFYNPTPILGGTVVPVPGTTRLIGTTDASGSFQFSPIPGGGGPATVYAQCAFSDASLPGKFGITNAVRIDILP